MKERWFVFIAPGNCFGVGTKEDEITFVGVGGLELGWVGKKLSDIRPYCVENRIRVIELKK